MPKIIAPFFYFNNLMESIMTNEIFDKLDKLEELHKKFETYQAYINAIESVKSEITKITHELTKELKHFDLNMSNFGGEYRIIQFLISFKQKLREKNGV